MRVALVSPPFLPVPPPRYGGTELFIAQLAEGLQNAGVDVVVYANGESTVGVETRWLYEKQQWPISGEVYDNLKDFNHTSWAISDAANDCDIIHLHNVSGTDVHAGLCQLQVRLHHASRTRSAVERNLQLLSPS